ncbi:hypothetical protein [Planktomarina sp.]
MTYSQTPPRDLRIAILLHHPQRQTEATGLIFTSTSHIGNVN